MASLDRHDAAVAQPDLAFGECGVAGLDDAGQGSVPVEHETPVGARIRRTKAGGGDCRSGRPAPLLQQCLDCFGPQQRRVGEQHDDLADIALDKPAGEDRLGSADRIPGAARRRLHGDFCRGHGTGYLLHPGPEHDDGLGRIERVQRLDQVENHRLPGDLVQNLRGRRIEAGSLPGGEDDCGEAGLFHDTARPKAHRERNAIIGRRVA